MEQTIMRTDGKNLGELGFISVLTDGRYNFPIPAGDGMEKFSTLSSFLTKPDINVQFNSNPKFSKSVLQVTTAAEMTKFEKVFTGDNLNKFFINHTIGTSGDSSMRKEDVVFSFRYGCD